jgi:predicted O-methyltransferase YrrM
MDDIDSVRRIAAAIDGWLSDAQGRALHDAAARVTGRGIILEIGSWKGRSTVWLAHGARRAGARVHAVDPHVNSREDPHAQTLEEFTNNIVRAGVADTVEMLVMTSADAASRLESGVELLFVDGDHSLEGARADAAVWLPRVVAGGTVMFHDVATSGYSGPRRVFQTRICRSPQFQRVRRVGSMGIAERTSRRSAAQAFRARTLDLLLYLYDVEAVIKRALRQMKRARLHPTTATPS